jgi:hypothetical protein
MSIPSRRDILQIELFKKKKPYDVAPGNMLWKIKKRSQCTDGCVYCTEILVFCYWLDRLLGTGTRQLFDNEISKSGISSSQLNGYQTEVYHHIDAGLEVVYERVDSVPGSQAVSDILGLDFIPLCCEWLCFLILRKHFFEDRIQAFISLLLKKIFQMLAKIFNGYDISSKSCIRKIRK